MAKDLLNSSNAVLNHDKSVTAFAACELILDTCDYSVVTSSHRQYRWRARRPELVAKASSALLQLAIPHKSRSVELILHVPASFRAEAERASIEKRKIRLAKKS